jgi:FkbM family methyltransferase
LKQRFSHNGKVTIIAKGVGNRDETAQMTIFDDSSAYNTFSSKWVEALGGATPWRPNKTVRRVVQVPMTTLDTLIDLHGVPNYIKVDVEGYELQVIKGLSRPVPLLSVECNLPEFSEETKDIIRDLSKLSSRALYNFATTEPPLTFDSRSWLPPDEMMRVVDSGKYGFLELFYCDRAGAF